MVNRIADSVVNVPASKFINNADVELIVPIPTTDINSQSNVSAKQEYLPSEKAKKMTESMNRFMESTNTNLRFQYHEGLQEYYVTIVDSKTDEVVKEIPSKKLMDIYAAMRDFLGVLVDHKI